MKDIEINCELWGRNWALDLKLIHELFKNWPQNCCLWAKLAIIIKPRELCVVKEIRAELFKAHHQGSNLLSQNNFLSLMNEKSDSLLLLNNLNFLRCIAFDDKWFLTPIIAGDYYNDLMQYAQLFNMDHESLSRVMDVIIMDQGWWERGWIKMWASAWGEWKTWAIKWDR